MSSSQIKQSASDLTVDSHSDQEFELEGRELDKLFDRVHALDSVTFSVGRGEARGLVGENGAGKSTLINILTGVLQPDSGSIHVQGKPIVLKGPRSALDLGIAAVYQHSRLVPSLTVTENLELGDELTISPFGWLSRWHKDEIAESLEFVGLARRASAFVSSLSLADRQLVAIARAVVRGSRLLIFDEPTAALSPVEAHYLFDVVERLRAGGASLLYVTHRLEELPRVADQITVMRDGRVIAVRDSNVSERELVDLMAGGGTVQHDRELLNARRENTAKLRQQDAQLMTVEGLGDGERDGFGDVSFELARGEILGIVGLPDSGAAQLTQSIAGARRTTAGSIRINGLEVNYRSPRGALARGVGYLPGDRTQQGVLPNFSVRDTITLSALPRIARYGLLRLGAEAALADRLVAECQVRAGSVSLPLTALSGGNQQKALFARLAAAAPNVVVCEDPTAGVDVAGRESIYELITKWCEQGKAAIWNTSDLRELATICDRVLVMSRGRAIGVLQHRELSVDRLMAAQFGHLSDDREGVSRSVTTRGEV